MEIFNTGCNPVTSGLFQVDRGALGKPLRFFNAETGNWSRCEYDLADAIKAKDMPTAIGFLPWRGPFTEVTVPETVKVSVTDEKMVAPATEATEAKPKMPAKREKAAKKAIDKAIKAKAVKAAPVAKDAIPDGTVWFRADRQKWIAQMGGKQEAARDTKEACLAFLKKKYDLVGTVKE